MTTHRQEPAPTGRSDAAVKLAELLSEAEAGAGAGAGPGAVPRSAAGVAPSAQPAGRPARVAHRHSPAHRRRPRWRAGAFVASLVVLVAAIPVLGLVGQRILNQTHDGRVFNPIRDANAPGYQALVDPTPTALLVQVDSTGKATSATLLALGAGDRGGSVILLPLGTAVSRPAVGVDRLSVAYAAGGIDLLRIQVALALNVGVDEAVRIDDAKLAQLVGPAGALTIENPDSVTTASGVTFNSGPITLAPEQVGPFLAAANEGESDLNRLARQKLVWQAWLKALGAARADPMPGEVSAGAGRFLRTLAKGAVQVDTLAVTQPAAGSGEGAALKIDPETEVIQITKAVPFPRSPVPGARIAVRLLNGAKPGPIPASVTDGLVRGGAELTSVGNAQTFGRAKTSIEYYSPASKGRAEVLRFALGVGEVTYVARDDQSAEVTVTVGADLSAANTTVPVTPAVGPGG